MSRHGVLAAVLLALVGCGGTAPPESGEPEEHPLIGELEETIRELEHQNTRLRNEIARLRGPGGVYDPPVATVDPEPWEPIETAPVEPPTATAPRSSVVEPHEFQPPNVRAVELVRITTRTTDVTSYGHRMAWQMTLRNHTDSRKVVRAEIRFVDRDGFSVDTETVRGLELEPYASQTFYGDRRVRLPGALKVERVHAVLTH